MNKKKIVSLLVISVLLLPSVVVNAVTGNAVILGYDLVDSGGHMDYKVNTKYSTYVGGAASTWNSYLGSNVIREDDWSTVADCDIYDVTRSDVTWIGLTGIPTNWIPTGFIQLNTYYMDQLAGTTKKQLVIKHEFGHTLGCGENSYSDLNIMYPDLKYSNINLTIHDKASVDLARQSW